MDVCTIHERAKHFEIHQNRFVCHFSLGYYGTSQDYGYTDYVTNYYDDGYYSSDYSPDSECLCIILETIIAERPLHIILCGLARC